MAEPNALIDIEETLTGERYSDYVHAVHGIIWAPWNEMVVGKYDSKAAVLMQLRFDGSFGFVGGLVDKKPTKQTDIVDALHRECREEMNLNVTKFKFSTSDYLCSNMLRRERGDVLITHFYALKVTIDDIMEIEKGRVLTKEASNEVFGLTRVPLFTATDNRRGLPMFLNNMFVGSAKQQLLYALRKCEILSEDEMNEVLSLANKLRLEEY